MKIETNIETILEMMDRPAFCVSGGVIIGTNQAARDRMVVPGVSVDTLIDAGVSEYRDYESGRLCLSLSIGGKVYSAQVSRLGEMDIFTMEDQEEPELRAFALAAQELRQPLSQILSISDQLFPELVTEEHSSAADQLARLNRGLHRMLRIVGNMADAAATASARMELRDVTAVFQEIFDQAEPLCRSAGVRLSFTNHPVTVFSMVDSQKLERAVYNLLANSLKYAAPGGEITAHLTRRGNTMYLTVSDSGSGKEGTLKRDALSRFQREPGISDGRSGLGLGLKLVRSAAAAHNGTLLLDQTAAGGIRATISLPIIQRTDLLRSPTARIDYAGERDHSLIELSEALPAELYTPQKQ